jgi:hypothetical protein
MRGPEAEPDGRSDEVRSDAYPETRSPRETAAFLGVAGGVLDIGAQFSFKRGHKGRREKPQENTNESSVAHGPPMTMSYIDYRTPI